jgi:hypothetical protein
MKTFLTCCLVVLNIITTPLAFAEDKYEIRFGSTKVQANWHGPEDRVVPSYVLGFDKTGKPKPDVVIPVKMDTKAERDHALAALKAVISLRKHELRASVDSIAVSVDAYSRSHTDHRENRYIHNHTTGTVNHNHNHSGNVTHTGLVQHHYTGGYVSPSCSPSRGAMLGGNRYHYRYGR